MGGAELLMRHCINTLGHTAQVFSQIHLIALQIHNLFRRTKNFTFYKQAATVAASGWTGFQILFSRWRPAVTLCLHGLFGVNYLLHFCTKMIR